MNFLPLMWGKERRVPDAEKGGKKRRKKLKRKDCITVVVS
jgi:hypothetical protein